LQSIAQGTKQQSNRKRGERQGVGPQLLEFPKCGSADILDGSDSRKIGRFEGVVAFVSKKESLQRKELTIYRLTQVLH
jgi:hypothetical protein